MDQIITNFLKILKSKPINEWPVHELEFYIDEIITLYRYTDSKDKEACNLLKAVYVRVVDWCNEKREFTRFSKRYLETIHKDV